MESIELKLPEPDAAPAPTKPRIQRRRSEGQPEPDTSPGDGAIAPPPTDQPAKRQRKARAPALEVRLAEPEKPKAPSAMTTMAAELKEQLRREFAAAMIELSRALTRATRRLPMSRFVVMGWARAVVDILLLYVSEGGIVFIRLAIQTGALVAAFLLSPKVTDAESAAAHAAQATVAAVTDGAST